MIYLVLLAWLYFVLMLSVVQASVAAGVTIFVMLGVLPSWLMVWLATRRQRQRRQEGSGVDGE